MSVYWAFLLHLTGDVSRSLKATEWPVPKETAISLWSRLFKNNSTCQRWGILQLCLLFHYLRECFITARTRLPSAANQHDPLSLYTLVFRKHLLYQWKYSWARWGGCAPGRLQHQSAQGGRCKMQCTTFHYGWIFARYSYYFVSVATK